MEEVPADEVQEEAEEALAVGSRSKRAKVEEVPTDEVQWIDTKDLAALEGYVPESDGEHEADEPRKICFRV